MTDPCPGGCDWPGEPVWCPHHTSAIRRALRELPYLAGMYAAMADGHHEQPLNPMRANGSPPSPSAIADDLDELENALYDSERTYRGLAKLQGAPRHGGLATPVTEISDFLALELQGVLSTAFAVSFGLEILAFHRQLYAKTKAGTGRRTLPMRCPSKHCGQLMLTKAAHEDDARCAACGYTVPQHEYDALLAAELARNLEHAG